MYGNNELLNFMHFLAFCMFAWNPKCQNPFWHLNVVMISSPNLYWFYPSRILNRKPHYNATAGVIMIFCLAPHSCLSLSLRMNSWNMSDLPDDERAGFPTKWGNLGSWAINGPIIQRIQSSTLIGNGVPKWCWEGSSAF